MKIVSSRTLFIRQTDERTLAFLELLSEPTKMEERTVNFLQPGPGCCGMGLLGARNRARTFQQHKTGPSDTCRPLQEVFCETDRDQNSFHRWRLNKKSKWSEIYTLWVDSLIRHWQFSLLSSDWDWDLGPGTWDLGLGPGTWDLGPGTWDLGPGTWDLGPRT